MNTYKFLIILFHLPSILNYQTDQYSLFIGGSYLGMTNSKVYSIESTSEYNNGYSITIGLRGEFESDNLISFGMHLGYELTNFSFIEDGSISRRLCYKNHFIKDQIFVKYNNLFTNFDVVFGLQLRLFNAGNVRINEKTEIKTQSNPELFFNLDFGIEYSPEVFNDLIFFQPLLSIGLSDYSFGKHHFIWDSNVYNIGLNIGYNL
ncbi:MAG: hypothetical protein H6609_06755 [Ignavibacteriales bacterium]|nr:hypothetical protein [Ignavibacteriales bacterium]